MRYSLLRFAILVAVLVALYLVGARGWLLLLLAALISAALGYLLLARQRDEVTRDLIDKRRTGLDRRIDAGNDAEDADDDALRHR